MSKTTIGQEITKLLQATGKPVAVEELYTFLGEILGAKMTSIITVTEPKMRKKDNPYFGRIKKIAKRNVQLVVDYDNSVGNQREREGKEREDWAKGTSWHKPVFDSKGRQTPISCHKEHEEDKYLFVKYLNEGGSSEFLDTESGTIIPKETLEPWLQMGTKPINQGLNKTIVVATVALDNVKAIMADGKAVLLI